MKIIKQPISPAFTKNEMKFVLKTDNYFVGSDINPGLRYKINHFWEDGAFFKLDIFLSNGDPITLIYDVRTNAIYNGYQSGIYTNDYTFNDNVAVLINYLNASPVASAYLTITIQVIGTETFIFFAPKVSAISNILFSYSGAEVISEYFTSGAVRTRESFKVVANLMVEVNRNLPRFDLVCTNSSTPDKDGIVEFDIAKTLDEMITSRMVEDRAFFELIVSLRNETRTFDRSSISYYIHFFESWIDDSGNLVTGRQVITPAKTAIYNGITSDDLFVTNNFFDAIDTEGILMSWWPRQKIIAPNAADVLIFFFKRMVPAHRIYVERTYTDGITDESFITYNQQYPAASMVVIPSGLPQLKFITDTQASGKIIGSYKLWIADTSGNRISEEFTYYLDYTHYEKRYTYAFINALGAPQIIHFIGEKGHLSNIERRFVKSSKAWSGVPMIYSDVQQSHNAYDTFKARSGNQFEFSEVKAIRDLFFADRTYEIIDGLSIPINIISSELPEIREQQNIISVDFEYTRSLKHITGGADSNGLLKKLIQKIRSNCMLNVYEMNIEVLSMDIQESNDSNYEGLLSNAQIEWIMSLMRPNPVAIQLNVNTYGGTLTTADDLKMESIGLIKSFPITQFGYAIEGMIKNPQYKHDLAFPILIEARVRQLTTTSGKPDEWSTVARGMIEIKEDPAWYASVFKMQYWNNLAFGICRNPGSCIFYVDERGRRTTIAGSLSDQDTTTTVKAGDQALFTSLDTFVIDHKGELTNGFPNIYAICRDSNRLFKISRNRTSSLDERKNWDVIPEYTFPESGLRRSLEIHPFVRTAGGLPIFYFSEYSIDDNWSKLWMLYRLALGYTRQLLINLDEISSQKDGPKPDSALAKVVDIKFNQLGTLFISEYGHLSKSALVRVLEYNGTNAFSDRINGEKYNLSTIIGYDNDDTPLAGTELLNDAPASLSIPMTLGNAKKVKLHDGAAGQLVIINDVIYMAASTGHCILKIYQIDKSLPVGNRNNWRVEVYSGANSVSGHYYELNSYSRYNDPSGLATDGKYLWVGQLENGAVARIDIQNSRAILLSGEQNKTLQQDTKYR